LNDSTSAYPAAKKEVETAALKEVGQRINKGWQAVSKLAQYSHGTAFLRLNFW
jgi:hypothetical protein